MREGRKTALVASYFDRMPPWLDFWLLSIRANPSIDIIFFSNLDLSAHDVPSNLKVVACDFPEFLAEMSRAIRIPVASADYSKVADLRPTFGESLSAYLTGYDYWGHIDVDNILGDIESRVFSTGADHDTYAVFNKFPAGFLGIYRNTPAVNTAWRRGHGHGEFIRSPRSTPLDEVWFGKVLQGLPGLRHDWRLNVARLCRGQRVRFDNGRILAPDGEYACYHFSNFRDKMTVFDYRPGCTIFDIRADGMRSAGHD